MSKVREFAIENIYCAPSEDRQYRFNLVQVNNPKYPVGRFIMMYDRDKLVLPEPKGKYHVYVIGRTPPPMLNLGEVNPACMDLETGWVNVESDMNDRQFIFQMYDDKGINLPRKNIFYTICKQGHLVIAVKDDAFTKGRFNLADFRYIRVYSNHYTPRLGEGEITIESSLVVTKQELVSMMRKSGKPATGATIIYVNGMMCRQIDPKLTGSNLIELVYDSTIKTTEEFKLTDLRTFESIKDKRLKYFMFRERNCNYIEYHDDLEIYISTRNKQGIEIGVYFYQNVEGSARNVTDKDFSLDSIFVNNQARWLCQTLGVPTNTVNIVMYTRKQNYKRHLIYNATKLHELYKLPVSKEYNVMSAGGVTIPDWTAPSLENSEYFNVAGKTWLGDISSHDAMAAIGYNGVSKYFADTPNVYYSTHDKPPILYERGSLVYEYDKNGVMLEANILEGSVYVPKNKRTTDLEYIQGIPQSPFVLYTYGDTIPYDKTREFVLIGALHESGRRYEDWKDLTDSPKILYHDKHIEILNDDFTCYRIRYLDEPYVFNVNIDIARRFPLINLIVNDTYKGVTTSKPIDSFYDTLEVFLNGYHLVEGVDFFLDFPTIAITNKTYLRYANTIQRIHIRCTGVALNKEDVNKREVKGFVHHGVLTRNKHYDIRDDRVFSAFVNGRLVRRDSILFAEEDNTVRTDNILNGVPYVICDKKLSLLELSEVPTEPYFQEDQAKNERISGLFDKIFPEPEVPAFNVKRDWHYIYSPLVSWMLRDVLDGVIPPTLYTKMYNDMDIRNLIEHNYKQIAELDPIKENLSEKLVEIHPDYGNAQITVNIFQFRFMQNVVRILTNGNIDRVNLSTYLLVNRESDEMNPEDVFNPGGPCVDC